MSLLVELLDMVARVATAGAGYPFVRTPLIRELEGQLDRAAREHERGEATIDGVRAAMRALEDAWMAEVARAQREAGRK